MAAPSVIFLMADYGHDPTETAIPWQCFQGAGFDITFATEAGKQPACDKLMLTGWTQKLLGANKTTIAAYKAMEASSAWQSPKSWSSGGFSVQEYNVIFLPGGHEKSVRQQIDSPILQKVLAEYWPSTARPSTRHVAAICHGVLALSEATISIDGETRSVLWDAKSTALPGTLENVAYQGTRLILGDYYKTYGKGSDNVETVVKQRMKDPQKQWSARLDGSPFVVEDEKYNYFSGRFPPDAELLAKKVIERVKESLQ